MNNYAETVILRDDAFHLRGNICIYGIVYIYIFCAYYNAAWNPIKLVQFANVFDSCHGFSISFVLYTVACHRSRLTRGS